MKRYIAPILAASVVAVMAVAILEIPSLRALAQTIALNVGTLNPLTAGGTITIAAPTNVASGVYVGASLAPSPGISGVNGAAPSNQEYCEIGQYAIAKSTTGTTADGGFAHLFAAIDSVSYAVNTTDGGVLTAPVSGTPNPVVTNAGIQFTASGNSTMGIYYTVCGH